jgi:hypothetical protein
MVMGGHDPQIREAGARLLKVGQNEGSIEVKIGSDLHRTTLVRDRGGVIVQSSQTTPLEAAQAVVLGFPALRGAPSGNPKGPASLDPTMPEPSDVRNLVNGQVDGRFADFKQWLVNTLDLASRGIPRALMMKDLLDNIIRELVPGQFQSLAPLDSNWTIKVRRPSTNDEPGEEIPLEDISQGMSSIFNWVGVLVQRLHDFYPDSPRPASEAAVVLVDEIDVHLHPDWQRRLVTLTRRFFPKTQVIATSHSALLAGALRGPELCILDRDPASNRVRRLPIKIDLFGRNSRDILTSVVFGMQTDRNTDAEQKIHDYFRLYEQLDRTDTEQTKMEKLERDLQAIGFGEAQLSPGPELSPETISDDQLSLLQKRMGRPASDQNA